MGSSQKFNSGMGYFIVGCVVADVSEDIFMLLIPCIFLHSVHKPANAFDEILVINCVLDVFFKFYRVPLLVDGFYVLTDSSAFIFTVVSLKTVLHSILLFVVCLVWEMRHCTPSHTVSHSPKIYNNTIVKTSDLSSS